ncbi:MAG: hypothetical protein DHS20C07_15290 [Methyloligella sp.]|nr:MAG: hypothetical protein DHS20C07_15290 [Methyloligella sp.]
MKIAIVTMVKDSISFLPEFITHYEKLADTIFVVDHNSQYDLGRIHSSKIKFIRADLYTYFQEECTNLIIDHFKIRDEFDWLFVLDVDEFLPFYKREKLENLLRSYAKDKVLSYSWKNGLAVDETLKANSDGIIDSSNLIFYERKSRTVKSAVNIKAIKGNFFVPRSAHNIAYYKKPLWHRLLRGDGVKFYKSQIIEQPLFHIVSLGKEDFEEKIKNFKKMRKMMDGVNGIGGSLIYSYPETYSFNELLRYVANYRVGNIKDHFQATRENFQNSFNFNHLDKDRVKALRERFLSKKSETVETPSEIEKKYLGAKKAENNFYKNQKWFSVTNNREVIISEPE